MKYSQCSISGRDSMIIALFQIGFPGCIAWGHHTSIVGFDIDTKSHYTPSTTITAIPTGIKILNWFSSIWSSCIHWITPIYFIVGFPFSSSFGGVTGIICANRMIDTPPHDTYFVVGHSHYASSPGAVHTFFAAFYNYTPYFTSYNEFYGRLHFISSFISSSVLSPPMHQLGVNGFPRRTFDYPVTYLRYQWVGALGMMGIVVSMMLFLISLFWFQRLIFRFSLCYRSNVL
jgi:cytochrome c oxidase subunit 1